MPLIQPRIGRYLQGEAFKDEFSHTLLHNHDLFKAFKQQKLLEEKQRQEDLKKKEIAAQQEF